MFGIQIVKMAGEVTVSYEGIEHKVDIEDVNPEDLKDLFDIDFDVKFLLEVETEKTVLIKKKEKLKPNFTYLILHKPRKEAAHQTSLESWVSLKQNIVQHALMASKAVYEADPVEFLYTRLQDHNLKSVLQSQHGDCHFLLSEELESDRVYLSFRGTEDTKDLTEDLRIYQKAAVSGQARGKFHAGFLNRAELFPLQKIFADQQLVGKHLIVCGHSLGGAISSIVTTEILIEKERRGGSFIKDVDNVTFGAPLFGDETARRFLEEKKFSEHMFHLVAEKDPVPSLLSLAQSISAVKNQIDSQIRTLVGSINQFGGQDFYQEKKQLLLSKKDEYVGFLSTVGPFVEPVLGLASMVSPGKAGTAKMFVEGIKLLLENMDETKSEEVRRVYVPIGNFLFLGGDKHTIRTFHCDQFSKVIEALDILRDAMIEECLESHSLDNYIRLTTRHEGFFSNSFPREQVVCIPLGDEVDNVITLARKVEQVTRFQPKVETAELAAVTGPEIMILRLALIGENLFQICLSSCIFQFGFPFGQPELGAIVKKIPLGAEKEKVVVEQAMQLGDISISDHGSNIHIATQFGSCDYLMPKKNIRNIRLQSISQISKHESIALVIRKAVQRGMAVAQLRGDKSSLKEPIVTEILRLTEQTLVPVDHNRMTSIFRDNTRNIQFILSSKEEYLKVSQLCDKIEDFMRSPLKIDAEKSLLKKISIGALAVVGGGAFAYLAGPGLLVIGAVEALNVTGVATAGLAGTVGTGYVASRLFTEALADRNYVKVLKWITAELFRVFSEDRRETNPGLVQEVSDLRDDDSIYSNEKAMLIMFVKERGIDNFRGSGIESSTEQSKVELLRRIECIETVHRIRNILATQCFIGLVGLQDAGKTTLMNKIWSCKGDTGLFSHTEVPVLHQITDKLHIVDFPGSNSLDHHAKTFSICGAMNNMIIVVLPFTGDVSELVSEEVARVFEVMAGSESSRVLVCINKCGLYLRKLKEELKDKQDPVRFMKERYVSKLNEHFSSGSIRVKEEYLLFTDWEVDEEGRAFGLEGVEEVKEFIKNHLVELNVVNKSNIVELEEAVLPPNAADYR